MPKRSTLVVLETLAVVGLLATAVMLVFSWRALPDRVPGHFGVFGVPDTWNGRLYILIPLAVAVFQYALVTVLFLAGGPFGLRGRIRTRRELVTQEFVVGLKTLVVWICFAFEWAIVRVSHGAVGMARVVLPGGLLLLVLFLAVYVVRILGEPDTPVPQRRH